MAEISFSLIAQSTLKQLQHLKVEPAEAVIDVTGPLTDPSSLQKFRDAVSQSFEAHRKNLAELLLKHDELMGQCKSKAEAKQKLKQFTTQQDAAVKRIEKTLQEKMDAIKSKAAEGALALALKQSQFRVGVTWAAYKLTNSAIGIFSSVAEGATDLAARASIAKDIYDALKDLLKLAKDLWSYFESEQDVRSQIEATRVAIKKTKGKPTESLVNKLEAQLKAHGPKIAALEKSARGIATELEKLLKKADAGGDEMSDDLAPTINKSIEQIIALNEAVAKADDYHGRSQQALKDAEKKAVKDPSSWWDVFKKIDEWYETVDEWYDKVQIKELEDHIEDAIEKVVEDYVDA